MSKRPIPWAIGVISLLYWGMLIYWQREALFDATSIPAATRSDAVTAAWFGFILSFVHVGYVMACFMVEMPEPLKEVPVIGKFGKMLGWMLMVLLVVCTPGHVCSTAGRPATSMPTGISSSVSSSLGSVRLPH